MRHLLKILIAVVFVLSLLAGVFTVSLVSQIRDYGTLINYVGIVRGATQRLVKLEISGIPSPDLVAYLDSILQNLNTGQGKYGLVKLNDPDYNNNLRALSILWQELKTEIQAVRNGAPTDGLLQLSEVYFKLANDTVFAADLYSVAQTNKLSIWIILIVMATAATWVAVLIFYLRRLNRLEHDNRGLADIAYFDRLTGAPNLEKFKLDAQYQISSMPSRKFAVIYVDFNNFKYMNDVFGYSYGDSLLCEYTNILKESLGPTDVFCRVSADNFLILRAYESKEKLLNIQHFVDIEIAKFALATKEKNFISMSGGICCCEDLDEQLQISDLIERANFARKSAKATFSRTSYVFYDESIRQRMLSEKDIENNMHAALDNGEFIVYMQPKVNIASGQIASAEALVRWRMASGELMSPGIFIPLFEKNLFIIKLDKYVFEQVCIWLHSRIQSGQLVVPVAVNVSRMQLYDPSFVDTYVSIKNMYNIPDYLLEIEFTESVVYENISHLLGIIKSLKANGFCCALDDFGNGYSSLHLLKNLPVDVLKIDGMFFREAEDLARANTVVKGIVLLAKQLNLLTVAEGVEHEEQVSFLRSIGCDLVQGFIYYKPMPIVELEKLLLNKDCGSVI